VIAGLEAVDVVAPMEEDRPLTLLLRWKPDLYIKGGDYSAGSLRSAEAVRAYGGSVQVIEPEFTSSSSLILERIELLAAHANPDKAPERALRGLALLDRDGTLIRDVPFLHDPQQVEILPGVVEGLKRLQNAGLRLAIVSNQQGIGLGYYTVEDFIAVNRRLFRELAPHGIRIARVYFCPHSMADQCACRKPAAGMVHRAMREFGCSPGQTFLIGDTDADIEAARVAGCGAVLVSAGGFSPAAEQVVSELK
jgi:D-glycero-D-manno-heptose 1,7-bisphosphate phosphatase